MGEAVRVALLNCLSSMLVVQRAVVAPGPGCGLGKSIDSALVDCWKGFGLGVGVVDGLDILRVEQVGAVGQVVVVGSSVVVGTEPASVGLGSGYSAIEKSYWLDSDQEEKHRVLLRMASVACWKKLEEELSSCLN